MHLFKLGVFALMVVAGPALARHGGDVTRHSDTVSVAGLVEHSLTLSTTEGQGIQLRDGAAHEMRNEKGEVKKVIPAFKGYLLSDIVAKATPLMPEHKEQGKFIVVVTAGDGYTVVFSYNELRYGAARHSAWLIPAAGIDALRSDGPFVVLCTSDTVSAPRFVKWVKSIEVRKI